MVCNSHQIRCTSAFVHSCVVVVVVVVAVAFLAIFVFEPVAFVAWFGFLVLWYCSIRNGLRLLGPLWSELFLGHNANSTSLIWWNLFHSRMTMMMEC